MATLGVKIDSHLASEKQRIPIASLYKGLNVHGIHIEQNRKLAPCKEDHIDLTNSKVVMLLVQAFTKQSNAVDVTFKTSGHHYTVRGLEFIDWTKTTHKIVKLVPSFNVVEHDEYVDETEVRCDNLATIPDNKHIIDTYTPIKSDRVNIDYTPPELAPGDVLATTSDSFSIIEDYNTGTLYSSDGKHHHGTNITPTSDSSPCGCCCCESKREREQQEQNPEEQPFPTDDNNPLIDPDTDLPISGDVIEKMLVDKLPKEVKFTVTGMLIINSESMKSMTIKNTSRDKFANYTLVY